MLHLHSPIRYICETLPERLRDAPSICEAARKFARHAEHLLNGTEHCGTARKTRHGKTRQHKHHPMAQATDFNDIYVSLHERVYRLAVGIVGCRQEAEDVAQELYERLWPRRAAIAALANPAGYILASARNMSLDRLRRRRPRVELSAARDESGDERREEGMAEVVARLVAALPEKQRTAMHLRDVECMEMDEIAEIMQIRPTAVRMALSRARGTVRDRLLKIVNYGL